MPELPEVETTLRGLSPHLLGQKVTEVIVRDSRLRWPIPSTIHELEGQTLLRAERRAKYLLFQTSQGTLLLHLGMSGSLRVSQPDIPWKKHDHLAIQLANGSQVRLHDPRRFGAALWFTTPPGEHELLRHLGPEPLTEAFTPAYLRAACRGKKAPIKSVIMDAHVVVGVGNIYACEALFMASIRPTKAGSRVSVKQAESLVTAIQTVLQASIEMGGTTLRDFVNERGEPGYFKQTLRVYDREGLPCPRCDRQVKRLVMTGRSTFYCSHCQK